MIKNIRFQIGWGSSIGIRASKFFGVRKTSAQIFPKLPKKLFCDFCLQIFSCKSHDWKPFLVWPPKKGLLIFLQSLGAIFSQIFWECA